MRKFSHCETLSFKVDHPEVTETGSIAAKHCTIENIQWKTVKIYSS